MERAKSEFDQLILQTHQQAKRTGMKRSDITKAIKQVRKEERDKQSGNDLPESKPFTEK